MKILIDASQIIYGTGVSLYTKELIGGLLRQDSGHEFVLFGGSLRRRQELRRALGEFQGAVAATYPFPPYLLDLVWNRMHVFSIEKLVGKIDIYHSSDWAQAPSEAAAVSTIHDFSPLKFPADSHPRIVGVHTRRLEWVKKEVERVIVPTRAMREEAVGFGIESSRVVVVPEGVSGVFYRRKKIEIARVKRELGVVGDFLLAFGTSKRKNVERIYQAFVQVREKLDINKLVIVGNASHNIKATEGVVFTGHVSDDALAGLYSGARALVYASLYEGFGLPILQSFSTDCPVVTSDLGAMKEVAGDAAVLVDPLSVASIAEGIMEMESRGPTVVKLAKKRLDEYSWERTARETMGVYNEFG